MANLLTEATNLSPATDALEQFISCKTLHNTHDITAMRRWCGVEGGMDSLQIEHPKRKRPNASNIISPSNSRASFDQCCSLNFPAIEWNSDDEDENDILTKNSAEPLSLANVDSKGVKGDDDNEGLTPILRMKSSRKRKKEKIGCTMPRCKSRRLSGLSSLAPQSKVSFEVKLDNSASLKRGPSINWGYFDLEDSSFEEHIESYCMGLSIFGDNPPVQCSSSRQRVEILRTALTQ